MVQQAPPGVGGTMDLEGADGSWGEEVFVEL
jgi:hypothetical protein